MPDKITLAHGAGGIQTEELIRDVFAPAFYARGEALHDSACLPGAGRLAFTSDSFVVEPLRFPGGDIGKLAVCGTVNDLLCSGSAPRYLSASFILGEGLDAALLSEVVASMARTAAEAGVRIVTGDTKVVQCASPDGSLYINTAGVGFLPPEGECRFEDAREGDALLVTGTIGEHQACILSRRLDIVNDIVSDAAPLGGLVSALLTAGVRPRGVRDITRGGLATVAHEVAQLCALRVVLDDGLIPVSPQVRSLCAVLGMDPLYFGCEGRMLICVPQSDAARAVQIIRGCEYGGGAAVVGELQAGHGAALRTRYGGMRAVMPLPGDAVPRIC